MSPKTKEQFAEIRSRSEKKILDAALELFGSKGFKATSISSIALKANVSKGLLYNYFDSKTDLLRRIVKDASNIGADLINEVIDEYASPEEELEHLVLKSVSHVKSNTHYWYLMTALSFQSEVMEEIQDIVDQNSKWSIEKGVELFTKMGVDDPLEESLYFGATLDGIVLHYLYLKDQYPIDRIARKLIDSYCNNPNKKNK